MKTYLHLLFGLICCISQAQIDAGSLMGLPTAIDLAEITGIIGPQVGSVVFNLDDEQIYRYTGVTNGWQAVDGTGDTIYSTDGTLTGDRTMTMGNFNLQFNSDLNDRNTLTLRRTNNANEVGIAFKNSGNAYAAAIAFGTVGNGNSNGLNFYAGGNHAAPSSIVETLSLKNNNQIKFSQYGAGTPLFLNNSPAYFLGVESDGDVVEVDPSALGTDDQNASEVPLVTNVDVNEGAIASPTAETTVEEVIQAIAPITSRAARVFYPPSIEIDASVNGTFSVDLYAMYTAQFGSPTAVSAGAPPTVPLYAATDLYYYVTFADPTVFNNTNMSITASGVLTYTIVGQPLDFNTLINVVFVVK